MKEEKGTPEPGRENREEKKREAGLPAGAGRFRLNRRTFLSAAAAAGAGASILTSCGHEKKTPNHRWIDREKCIACGSCVPLCPMSAISLREGKSRVDPEECAECGVCRRSRVCPVDAIQDGELVWPRTLRAAFSNPVAEHRATHVPGRGTEGIKTNDYTNRYQRGWMGVFVELGRPALGARFRDVEKAVKRFRAEGWKVVPENPVFNLISDERTGSLRPEILGEKVISCLVEFLLPESAAQRLLQVIEELAGEVATVFTVSVALRADPDGASPFRRIFGPEVKTLPNGKVNLGLAQGIGKNNG